MMEKAVQFGSTETCGQYSRISRPVDNTRGLCISTGKEANLYHASTATGDEIAVKVYKTSMSVFKDRERYVLGDFRFRHGYCKSNPRKMVKTWAEKEMRNLARKGWLGSSTVEGCCTFSV